MVFCRSRARFVSRTALSCRVGQVVGQIQRDHGLALSSGSRINQWVLAKKAKPPAARLRDRAGREWTIQVTTVDDDDDLLPWLNLSPAERIDIVGECILDGLRVRGMHDLPRFRSIYRIIERQTRALPDRRGLRRRVSRATASNKRHRRTSR